jgi:hypothetical protein
MPIEDGNDKDQKTNTVEEAMPQTCHHVRRRSVLREDPVAGHKVLKDEVVNPGPLQFQDLICSMFLLPIRIIVGQRQTKADVRHLPNPERQDHLMLHLHKQLDQQQICLDLRRALPEPGQGSCQIPAAALPTLHLRGYRILGPRFKDVTFNDKPKAQILLV